MAACFNADLMQRPELHPPLASLASSCMALTGGLAAFYIATFVSHASRVWERHPAVALRYGGLLAELCLRGPAAPQDTGYGAPPAADAAAGISGTGSEGVWFRAAANLFLAGLEPGLEGTTALVEDLVGRLMAYDEEHAHNEKAIYL